MKVMVIGPTGSGKTTVATEIAKRLDTVTTDISTMLIDGFCEDQGVDKAELLANKDAYRQALYEYGRDTQRNVDPAYFVKEALKKGDVVCGVRPRDEYEQSKHLFDIIVWVAGRGEVKPQDDLSEKDATVVIDNSGDIEETKKQIDWMIKQAAITKEME